MTRGWKERSLAGSENNSGNERERKRKNEEREKTSSLPEVV